MCAGSKVTYRILIDNITLPGFCSWRGNVPVNVTMAPDIIDQLGIGCHHLRIYASNAVTFPDVSTRLQVQNHNLPSLVLCLFFLLQDQILL